MRSFLFLLILSVNFAALAASPVSKVRIVVRHQQGRSSFDVVAGTKDTQLFFTDARQGHHVKKLNKGDFEFIRSQFGAGVNESLKYCKGSSIQVEQLTANDQIVSRSAACFLGKTPASKEWSKAVRGLASASSL